MQLRRRRLIAASGLATAGFILPRVALGQADRRPSITIAVQQISNSASLEPLREQSNVGSRTFSFIFETLIMQNLMGQLENKPGLAESWKRIDGRTVELALRKGGKFHNGDEMTADDVVFTFSRERMFGPEYDISSNKTLFTSVLIRDSVLGAHIRTAQPWTDMSGFSWKDARLLEYRNTGPGAGVNSNRPQLSDASAASYTAQRYLAGSDGWNPVVTA